MMSDFEQRVADVLTAESEQARATTDLAAAARRRHVHRRRQRIAVATAAAVVVAAPVAVVLGARGDGEDVVATDRPATPTQWQTVAKDDVRAEVPGDWTRFTCDFDGFTSDVYGPTERDACGFGTYLAFYSSATYDAISEPGVVMTGSGSVGGYVYAGDQAVSVSTTDRDLTLRILGSARVDGQPEADARTWVETSKGRISYRAPLGWGIGAAGGDGYRVTSLEVEPIDETLESSEQLDATHFEVRRQLPGVLVTVVAPTQAVAELVAESAELVGPINR